MDPAVLKQMRDDWDQRARENAKHYVQNAEQEWDEREFFRSGEMCVANEVMPDMLRICGGHRSPRDLSMLEIGCGVGRMTFTLAKIFGHVTAVDVSPKMVAQAKANLADCLEAAESPAYRRVLRRIGGWLSGAKFPQSQNVSLIVGDGATLKEIPDSSIDFAFSFIVFQHIPSYAVIESYCREVRRVLKPGSIFKFQVQGGLPDREDTPDTWQGVSFTEEQARKLADDTGFQLEMSEGAGTQYFWIWFRKPRSS